MAYRLFEGKDHAASYWKYRICPSDHLIQQVLDFLEKQKGQPFELAVDVGCGSGQGTVLLAKHFASVVGTDVSPAQLEMALQHAKEPNITYRMENEFLQEWVVRSAKIGRAFYTTRVPIILLAFFIADVLRSWFKFLSTTVPRQCVAEELPFADSSVDLLTAMSAFHWFDRPRFIKEVHRVLKSRGCLALLNYTIDLELSYPDCCSQTLNQVCKEFYAALQPYRSPHLGPSSIELYREAYESIPYSDKEWQECVWVRRSMPLSSYMGLVESFSSYQALLRVDMQKAIRLSQDICQRFMSIMGVTSAETEVVVGVKYFYLLACKPQQA